MPDILWWPLLAAAVVCGGAGYVLGALHGERGAYARGYRRGQREGIRVGWEGRGQARHEGALEDWQRERDPRRWTEAQAGEGGTAA